MEAHTGGDNMGLQATLDALHAEVEGSLAVAMEALGEEMRKQMSEADQLLSDALQGATAKGGGSAGEGEAASSEAASSADGDDEQWGLSDDEDEAWCDAEEHGSGEELGDTDEWMDAVEAQIGEQPMEATPVGSKGQPRGTRESCSFAMNSDASIGSIMSHFCQKSCSFGCKAAFAAHFQTIRAQNRQLLDSERHQYIYDQLDKHKLENPLLKSGVEWHYHVELDGADREVCRTAFHNITAYTTGQVAAVKAEIKGGGSH